MQPSRVAYVNWGGAVACAPGNKTFANGKTVDNVANATKKLVDVFANKGLWVLGVNTACARGMEDRTRPFQANVIASKDTEDTTVPNVPTPLTRTRPMCV